MSVLFRGGRRVAEDDVEGVEAEFEPVGAGVVDMVSEGEVALAIGVVDSMLVSSVVSRADMMRAQSSSNVIYRRAV